MALARVEFLQGAKVALHQEAVGSIAAHQATLEISQKILSPRAQRRRMTTRKKRKITGILALKVQMWPRFEQ